MVIVTEACFAPHIWSHLYSVCCFKHFNISWVKYPAGPEGWYSQRLLLATSLKRSPPLLSKFKLAPSVAGLRRFHRAPLQSQIFVRWTWTSPKTKPTILILISYTPLRTLSNALLVVPPPPHSRARRTAPPLPFPLPSHEPYRQGTSNALPAAVIRVTEMMSAFAGNYSDKSKLLPLSFGIIDLPVPN